MEIRLMDLRRNYGSLHAVDDVSLVIPSNTVYGIIGRSGAGKSTLVRLISMLEKPDSGEVYYNEKRVDNLSKEGLIEERRRIGMIFQTFNLFSSRNAEENIAYPMEICHMDKAYIHKRTEELLELVGLESRGKAPISTLSGGQKQRVAIARALATKPSILFCDEATSALDPQTTRSILALIKEIQKKMNLTVVMITHQMDVVKQICDRVAVMNKGVVVEEGSVIDVFRRPQSETTKALIGNVMAQELPATMIERVREQAADFERDSVHILRLSFVGSEVTRPVVTEASRMFDIDFNILLAQVDEVQGKGFGTLTILTSCSNDTFTKLIDYLRKHNVAVEEVTSHVL